MVLMFVKKKKKKNKIYLYLNLTIQTVQIYLNPQNEYSVFIYSLVTWIYSEERW